MTETNGVDYLRRQILDESDELLRQLTPVRVSEEKEAPAQPDLDRIIHGLHLEMAGLASRFDQLVAKVNALQDHHDKLVNSLTQTFQKKNISARLEQLEKRNERFGERLAAVEEKGVNFCGTYQRGNQYRKNEWVGFDGSGWIALSDVQPLEQPGTSPKWQQIIRKGKDGRDGIDAIADPSEEPQPERRLPTRGGHHSQPVQRRT